MIKEKRILGTALALICLTALATRSSAQTISVNKLPPFVEERYFDPKDPPNPPPPIPRGNEAVTHWDYRCDAYVRVDYLDEGTVAFGTVKARVKVTNYDVTLHLPIIIWLPFGVSDKVREHEHGHATIDERIYAHADQMARAAALKLLGKEFVGTGTSLDSARQNAMDQAIKAFCDQYHADTKAVADRLDDSFDKITRHGNNKVPTQEAIDRVLGQEGF